ncbi:MAG: helix-turn-helix domain-containing protein [Ruminococcus bromii]|uniref:helix-turn-helix domain-containing protein n=1 Tax=Ruminococcus sp. TaxID=41978 RepID=UPI002E842086|nr:helix-turn-helix domain-containing protein [Ruminococcus sp.]MEE3499701.1 helix-turn-helix domain-containing protein [Ruminococcus bromii]
MKQLKDMFSEYGDIVTVEEVMKMLQIGRVSVYQMLKSGEIRSLKVGKKYVIPKKSVIELFDFQ